MKKIFALAVALVLSVSAHADTLELLDFQFSPPAQVGASTEPGFEDNFTLDVGGRNALFNGAPLVVYSLERAYGDPVGPTEYISLPNYTASVGQLFTVAGPITDAVQSGALQLAIWRVNGTMNFDVVDDLDGADALATTWLSQITSQTPVAALTAFENKSYNYFVATAPIPEPGTYILLLAGIAVVTWVVRRKTQ